VSEQDKQWNPYLAMTPCCGKVFCLKCTEIGERINELLDGKGSDEAQRYGDRQHRRLVAHLAKYDHESVEVDG
jgi:hypothetical protein